MFDVNMRIKNKSLQ